MSKAAPTKMVPTRPEGPRRQDHPLWALMSRYAAVFAAAWQARHELAGPRRLADERAFLPAALSLQDTPPHPAPRRTALAVCALFAAAVAWACLGRLDVVAVAPGRIVVSERSKTVQPLEAAVVRAIHVRDGDRVAAGQLLIELDPTTVLADGGRVVEARRAAYSEQLRAQALLDALADAPLAAEAGPPRLSKASGLPRLSADEPVEGWRADDAARAEAQLQAEWQEHLAQRARLAAEQARRSAELATTREVVAKLAATLPIARQREADYRGLSEQGFVSGHAGQDRLRERLELERELATARGRIVEVQAALAEGRQQQAALLAEARRRWHDRAADARRQLADLAQEHTKASHRSAQTRLTAPVAGTVQQLAVHTTGGVVTPAQPLMVIVPEPAAGDLVAEVHIENKDIGFVRPGQRAEVKFETFNFTRYGTVPATVQWVTADAVVQGPSGPVAGSEGEAGPARAVFPARLVLALGHITIDGQPVRLSPGLNLTAEVKIGHRRVIDYLLSPVQASLGESLRER